MTKNRLPVKKLLISSTGLAVFLCVFISATGIMEGGSISAVGSKTVSVFLSFFLVSSGNIGLLLLFKIKDLADWKKKSLGIHLLSFLISFIVVASFYFINHYLIVNHIIPAYRETVIEGYFISLYLFIQGILINTFVLLIQGFTIVQDANEKARVENLLLKSAKSEAAYELLLQQIHPHFLFNALNILKTLIKKQPVVAEDYLVRLSHFLRSSLSQNKSGKSLLSEELKLCTNYLEMQKIRFGTALTYNFDVEGKDDTTSVLPVFSLQPLLENAIKHNELTEAEPLHIQVKQDGSWITVSNNVQLKSSAAYSMGNGLTNLAERYELLSGDQVMISNTGKTFSVTLKILKGNT